jgi:hypothetical protein
MQLMMGDEEEVPTGKPPSATDRGVSERLASF